MKSNMLKKVIKVIGVISIVLFNVSFGAQRLEFLKVDGGESMTTINIDGELLDLRSPHLIFSGIAFIKK